jgi:hypothetical protein
LKEKKNFFVLALFYTFETNEGNEFSLTATHALPVFDPDENQIKIISAAKVTLKHRLFMLNRTVEIKTITFNQRIGYYAPLTLTGYLLVNNISASCFLDK